MSDSPKESVRAPYSTRAEDPSAAVMKLEQSLEQSHSNSHPHSQPSEDGSSRSSSLSNDEGTTSVAPSAAVSASAYAESPDTSVINDPLDRCTSPRRDNDTIDQIGKEKVHVLRREAQLVQENLGVILGRISKAKEEHDRLSNENKFLQDYIGNLVSTSNILNKKSSN